MVLLKIRYVMKCGQKNFLQGLNLDRMVHLAVERCFVGEIVHLAFCFTGNRSSPHHLQANVLPAMKASNLNTDRKIPELLANGICRIQNDMKHKSVADGFREHIAHFEKNVETDNLTETNSYTTEDRANSVASKENINSIIEKDCDIDDVVSPSRLLDVNSSANKLMLSMMSSGNESAIKVEDFVVSKFKNLQHSTCCEHYQVTGMKSNKCKAVTSAGRMHTSHENLSLTDLQQSLCCTSNEDEPYVLTSIKEDKLCSDFLITEDLDTVRRYCNTGDPCSKSDIQSDVLKADTIPWDEISGETTLVSTFHLQQDRYIYNDANSANNDYDMMLDSQTSEDLDIFLTQVGLTRRSEKSDYDENRHCPADAVESNSSSNSDAVHLDHDRKTGFTSCFTSTPSLDNPICHESVINCAYSPIYSHSITTPRGRIFCDTEIDKGFARGGEALRDMFTPPEKPRSGKFECVSYCISPSISLKTKCKKSSSTQPFKGKRNDRNLLRCVTSNKKSTRCSKRARIKISMNVSNERDQAVLKPLNVSPEVSSPYMPQTRRTTFIEKCSERSLLLFEDTRNVDELENDAPVTLVCSESQIRSKDPNSCPINWDRHCSKDSKFNEDSFVTCASPLLFSP